MLFATILEPGDWQMLQGTTRYKNLGFMGYPMYKVGSDGTVWSKNSGIWKELNTTRRTGIALRNDGGIRNVKAGRLVLYAFVGDFDEVYCNHKNGNLDDNSLSNLEWQTASGIQQLKNPSCISSLQKRDSRIRTIRATVDEIEEDKRSGLYIQRLLREENGNLEVWRDVNGYIGYYQVSNKGRIKSLERTRLHQGGTYRISEKIMASADRESRYITIDLHREGKSKTVSVHTLVLLAFLGPCPEGMQCCHCDGNGRNNRLENLRWDTPSSNQTDRYLHGTADGRKGRFCEKITKSNVRRIQRLLDTKKYSYSSISSVVCLPKNIIRKVAAGGFWEWMKI